MSESTRRNFLIASGAGAAAVGVAAALPSTASAAAEKQTAGKPTKNAEPLVAHVGDPRTGMVSLFVADRELVLHDPDLVARLTRAAGQSKEA